ncbi:MAG TPA: PadR family transcriptional regulator [Plantibacter sp.]|uniref:PadR family transcriptional regulator n=1 Tax=unclassified Plantibacter TaxID=2624265 RepID=UPI002C1628AE|nr:PadR family transcriptional regulator [Plantibacter sp.]
MSRIQAQQNAQVIRAALPLLTLTLIGNRESYGYEIVERLSDLGLSVSTGLVYPVLSRLERDALVTTWSVASSNGPPRKYFALTPAGRDARNSALDQWQLVSSAVAHTLTTEGENNA